MHALTRGLDPKSDPQFLMSDFAMISRAFEESLLLKVWLVSEKALKLPRDKSMRKHQAEPNLCRCELLFVIICEFLNSVPHVSTIQFGLLLFFP